MLVIYSVMHITHAFIQKIIEKLDIGKLDNTLISAIDENVFVKKQLLNSWWRKCCQAEHEPISFWD